MLTYVKKGVVMSSRCNKFLNILKRQKKVELKLIVSKQTYTNKAKTIFEKI